MQSLRQKYKDCPDYPCSVRSRSDTLLGRLLSGSICNCVCHPKLIYGKFAWITIGVFSFAALSGIYFSIRAFSMGYNSDAIFLLVISLAYAFLGGCNRNLAKKNRTTQELKLCPTFISLNHALQSAASGLAHTQYALDKLKAGHTNSFGFDMKGGTLLRLEKAFPALHSKVKCPVEKCTDVEARIAVELAYTIVHLNDDHQWSREAIAGWLDQLDLNLSYNPTTRSTTNHEHTNPN